MQEIVDDISNHANTLPKENPQWSLPMRPQFLELQCHCKFVISQCHKEKSSIVKTEAKDADTDDKLWDTGRSRNWGLIGRLSSSTVSWQQFHSLRIMCFRFHERHCHGTNCSRECLGRPLAPSKSSCQTLAAPFTAWVELKFAETAARDNG